MQVSQLNFEDVYAVTPYKDGHGEAFPARVTGVLKTPSGNLVQIQPTLKNGKGEFEPHKFVDPACVRGKWAGLKEEEKIRERLATVQKQSYEQRSKLYEARAAQLQRLLAANPHGDEFAVTISTSQYGGGIHVRTKGYGKDAEQYILLLGEEPCAQETEELLEQLQKTEMDLNAQLSKPTRRSRR